MTNKDQAVVAAAAPLPNEMQRQVRLTNLRASLHHAVDCGKDERASELSDAILDLVGPCPTR